MSTRLVALLILGVSLAGCQSNTEMGNNPVPYFDIADALKIEQTWLIENQVTLIKHTWWNSHTSADTISTPNWDQELFFLKRLKISPASWQTDYTGQVLSDNAFRVTPRDTTSKIQEIKFTTNAHNDLVSLYAVVQSENSVTGTYDTISYNCKQHFSFYGKRETLVIGEENYSIKGTFAVANN